MYELLKPAFFLLITLATCSYSINRISWHCYVCKYREKQPEQSLVGKVKHQEYNYFILIHTSSQMYVENILRRKYRDCLSSISPETKKEVK